MFQNSLVFWSAGMFTFKINLLNLQHMYSWDWWSCDCKAYNKDDLEHSEQNWQAPEFSRTVYFKYVIRYVPQMFTSLLKLIRVSWSGDYWIWQHKSYVGCRFSHTCTTHFNLILKTLRTKKHRRIVQLWFDDHHNQSWVMYPRKKHGPTVIHLPSVQPVILFTCKHWQFFPLLDILVT